MSKPIAAVIPLFNCPELAEKSLQHLARSTANVWPIVIDNGSTNGTAELIEKTLRELFPVHAYERWTENRGFTAAVNRGLQMVPSGNDALILNTDCYVARNCVLSLQQTANRLYAITGPVVTDNGAESINLPQVRIACGIRHDQDPFKLVDGADGLETLVSWKKTQPIIRTYIPFCCTLIPEKIFRLLGLLHRHPAYASGLYADTEWCRRATAIGYRCVLDTNAAAIHLGSQTFKNEQIDYQSWLAIGRDKFDEKANVGAAILLCDRKAYSQMTAPQATLDLGVNSLYINIESKFKKDSSEFRSIYAPLLEWIAHQKTNVTGCTIEYDVWDCTNTSIPQSPTHDQDQYYRLPRIVSARNQACEWFWAKNDLTHLLFIDSDVLPAPGGLDALLAMQHPLCGGLVHGRGAYKSGKMVFRQLSAITDDVVECAWGTCGYMLIERQVLALQRFRWGESAERHCEKRSEDPAFCEDAFLNGFGRYWVNYKASAVHVDNPASPLDDVDRAEF